MLLVFLLFILSHAAGVEFLAFIVLGDTVFFNDASSLVGTGFAEGGMVLKPTFFNNGAVVSLVRRPARTREVFLDRFFNN